MSPKEPMGASLNPEDFSKGGILNDEDIECMDAGFFTGEDAVEQTEGLAKYRDYAENLFLGALLKVTSGESKGEQDWQYWSAGKLIYWEPSKDGSRTVKAEGSTSEKLTDSCNAYILMASLVDSGYPRDQFTDDVRTLLTGLKAHVIRVDQPKRAGLAGSSDGDRARTVLTVDRIADDSPVGLPGKKTRGKGRAKPTAVETSSNGKVNEEEEDLEQIALMTIAEVLIDADGGPIKKTSLFNRMLKKLQKPYPDDFKEIIKFAGDDEWLGQQEDFSFDGKELEVMDLE